MAVQVPISGREFDTWPQIVIIGAGFGGLRAAQDLKRKRVRVTLVDKHNYHLFQPLLYQVATAGIALDGIAYPVRAVFRDCKNATFRMAEVCGIDFERKLVLTDTIDIPYDYLMIAAGGETNFFGNSSVERNSFGLKDLSDATRIRNHVLKMFERAVEEPDPEKRKAMLTFVVVGGGPTGVESAGALSELIRLVLSREYVGLNVEDVRILLLEAAGRLLLAMPEDLGRSTEEVLRKKHVEVHFGAQVTDYDGEQVTLKDGAVLPACTLIWAAGVRAVDLTSRLGLPLGSGGRIKVEPTLQVPGHPEVFVIGDAAYALDDQGNSLPMVAPVAMQMADRVVKSIFNLMQGRPAEVFHYKDPGTLSTIGRNQAVAVIGRWKFQGFLAWLLWVFVHLLQLIGFRNRLVVLVTWLWDYINYDRSARLIGPE